jgi:hypothetical protein
MAAVPFPLCRSSKLPLKDVGDLTNLREISWQRELRGPWRGCPGKMQLKYLKTILQADDGIKKVTAITW